MNVSGIHERDGYVELRVDGPYASGDLDGVLVAALEAAAMKDGSRLLINMLDITDNGLMIIDYYQMGRTAARIPKGVRLAALLRAETADPGRLGIQVAQNRGALIERFFTEKEALAWLLRKDDPAPPTEPD